MADIFISHSSNDSEVAAAIGERIGRDRPTWSLFYDKGPCCTDQLGWGLGLGSVEDGPPLRERALALAGQGCTAAKPPRAAKRAEESQMGGRYPHP